MQLNVSVGAHSGKFELFLLGELHRELIVAGPGATTTTEMEAAASSGEVVVSTATAALLGANVLGEARGAGILVRAEPHAEERPMPTVREGDPDDAALLTPCEPAAISSPEKSRPSTGPWRSVLSVCRASTT